MGLFYKCSKCKQQEKIADITVEILTVYRYCCN